MTPLECLTELETRITARFTPSLNTASALEALILVAETIREMKAEVEAGDGATPQAETHDADGRCVECGLFLESCPVCGDSPEPQAEPGDEIARAKERHARLALAEVFEKLLRLEHLANHERRINEFCAAVDALIAAVRQGHAPRR